VGRVALCLYPVPSPLIPIAMGVIPCPLPSRSITAAHPFLFTLVNPLILALVTSHELTMVNTLEYA
jgi:hypothetical protein